MVRITPEDAAKMKDAYAKVYAPKEEEVPETQAVETEPPVEDEQKIYPVRDYTP